MREAVAASVDGARDGYAELFMGLGRALACAPDWAGNWAGGSGPRERKKKGRRRRRVGPTGLKWLRGKKEMFCIF